MVDLTWTMPASRVGHAMMTFVERQIAIGIDISRVPVTGSGEGKRATVVVVTEMLEMGRGRWR